MVRHRHCDAVRARRRRPLPASLDRVLDEPGGPVGERPEARVEQREVLAAVAALSDERRDVLVAVDIVGLSYAEAATLLGIPLGTVMSRLYRARESVARRCEREPVGVRPACPRRDNVSTARPR